MNADTFGRTDIPRAVSMKFSVFRDMTSYGFKYKHATGKQHGVTLYISYMTAVFILLAFLCSRVFFDNKKYYQISHLTWLAYRFKMIYSPLHYG
jgi:hypothetical protein